MPGKKDLLLCFDAFGTIFEPKQSVFVQYAEVARQLGMSGVRDSDVQDSFKKAFKHESKAHPNYGKKSNMGAEKWWTNIITNTFSPLLQSGQRLPKDLAPSLLKRFASGEGYNLFPDFLTTLQRLQKPPSDSPYDKIVVGVITNSDDRVPGILSSLGIRVSPLRYGLAQPFGQKGNIMELNKFDVHFHCMSYDVGVEKPDQKIFAAAEEMRDETLEAAEEPRKAHVNGQEWMKVYVGDDYDKDGMGAVSAGWIGAIICRNDTGADGEVQWVDDANRATALAQTSKQVLAFPSLSSFCDFLLAARSS